MAGDLCLECVLCCDSGLFGHLDVTDADRARLATAGVATPGRIEQPCRFWSGCCAIYDHRPATCRAFRCRLLRAAEAGEVDLDQARQNVATALALRDAMAARLPEGMTANRLAAQWRERGAAPPAEWSGAMLVFLAFRTFVEKHFLDEGQRAIRPEPVSPR